MVVGDEKQAVTKAAEELATAFWQARNKFEFVAPTASLDECLRKAISSQIHPFFISDMGDNPTAGGAGDVSWTLTEILSRPEFQTDEGPSLIYASLPGPDLIEKAIQAGIGNTVEGFVGAGG